MELWQGLVICGLAIAFYVQSGRLLAMLYSGAWYR